MSKDSTTQIANGAKANDKNTEIQISAKGTSTPPADQPKKDEPKPKPKTTAELFEKSAHA